MSIIPKSDSQFCLTIAILTFKATICQRHIEHICNMRSPHLFEVNSRVFGFFSDVNTKAVAFPEIAPTAK